MSRAFFLFSALVVATLLALVSSTQAAPLHSLKKNKNGKKNIDALPRPFKHRYQPFCNFVSTVQVERDASAKFEYEFCNQTQTGSGCTLRGCKPWSQGRFPSILGPGETAESFGLKESDIEVRILGGTKYRLVNGGVPQAANLTLHLSLIKETLPHHIPQSDYDGQMIFDFERFTPVWSLNSGYGYGWHAKVYQTYSIELVKEKHPTYTEKQAEELARTEFEAAAVNFFAESVKTVRSIRPRLMSCFYGIPLGGLGENPITPEHQAQNNRMKDLWKACNVISPSVYYDPTGSRPNSLNYAMVEGITQESVRLAEAYSSPNTVVLPFSWSNYHNNSAFLTAADVHQLVLNSYFPPRAVGMTQWGSWKPLSGTAQFLMEVFFPIVKMYIDKADGCSNARCSAHGYCQSLTEPSGGQCFCDKGYGGDRCQHEI